MPVKTGSAELAFERGARLLGDRVQRVVLLDAERGGSARRDPRGSRARSAGRRGCRRSTPGTSVEPLGRAVRHQHDGGAHTRASTVRACTSSVRRVTGVRVGLRQDPVAEVEDVAVAPARALEHVERRGLEPVPRREQRGGIEVALHAPLADELPALVERDAPVEPDHVAVHLVEQRRGPGAEVDRRHVDRVEDARAVRRDELARSPPARARRPTSRRAGSRPRPRPPARARSARSSRRASSISACQASRLAVHERLHLREVAARLALDQVAGDGERRAAEADDRPIVVELAAHDADRLARPPARPRRGRAAAPASNDDRRPGRRPRRAARRRPSRRPGS